MSEISTETVINAAVEDAKFIINELAQTTLRSYWNLGRLVANLTTKYGEGTVRSFAKRLAAETDKEYSETSLYRMRQFYERTPEDKLLDMVKAGLKWSYIANTLSADTSVVNDVIDKVIADEIPPEQFVSTVKTAEDGDGIPTGLQEDKVEVVPEATEDKLGHPKTLNGKITQITSLLCNTVDIMGDILLVIDKYENFDSGMREDFAPKIKEIYQAMKDLAAAGGAVMEQLKEIVDS